MGLYSTKMPDDFESYFSKWVAGEMTQKQIADELWVSQSVVSDWIAGFREKLNQDKIRRADQIEGFSSVLEKYSHGEISQREAGKMLGISHTAFRTYARKHLGDTKEEAQSQIGLDVRAAEVRDASEAAARATNSEHIENDKDARQQ